VSNYTKSTNFSAKDTLPLNDPAKIIKGTEFDVEFNAIVTAISSKSDSANPVFTGSPVAPTASPGTNTTQLATTAFVTSAAQALYPVGSIYINASNSTNPGTLLGFGTWVAFGAGRVPVGFNASDPLFDSAEETGGSKDAIVVSHTHSITDPGHVHTGPLFGEAGTQPVVADGGTVASSLDYTTNSNTTGISINSTGSSGTNANLQPYITVYMWKRTA
jgi:hypothetical protein